MSWKERYITINTGDLVRCILNPNPKSDELNGSNIPKGHGAGWEEGYEFPVTEITTGNPRILRKGIGDNGVYEDCVVKI